MKTPVIDYYINQGVIKNEQVKSFENDFSQSKKQFSVLMVELALEQKLISLKQYKDYFLNIQKLQWVDDSELLDIDKHILNEIPVDIVYEYHVLPLRYENSKLILVMIDPSDKSMQTEISFFSKKLITPAVANPVFLNKIFAKYYNLVFLKTFKNFYTLSFLATPLPKKIENSPMVPPVPKVNKPEPQQPLKAPPAPLPQHIGPFNNQNEDKSEFIFIPKEPTLEISEDEEEPVQTPKIPPKPAENKLPLPEKKIERDYDGNLNLERTNTNISLDLETDPKKDK